MSRNVVLFLLNRNSIRNVGYWKRYFFNIMIRHFFVETLEETLRCFKIIWEYTATIAYFIILIKGQLLVETEE